MIACELTGRGIELDTKVRDYVESKIGSLEKFVPRHVRDTARCNVILMEDPSGREDNRYVCEAVLTVGGDTMVSRDGTVNIYAAIDIVEAKLKSQLETYKAKHVTEPRRDKMVHRSEVREPGALED